MSFFAELKRRNVFKVGVAYAIVAWLLIQVADVLFPTFNAPDWVMQVFTVVLFLGFPIALVFAWAFELTTTGIRRDTGSREPVTPAVGAQKFNYAIIALLSVTVLFFIADKFVWTDAEPSPAVTTAPMELVEINNQPIAATDDKSVAVLPFANRSTTEDDTFFVDGIHDDILTHLSKISALKVISRTSVMQYRDTQKTMKTIGEELGVGTILEGGVQRAGQQVRINVQLIDADTDKHLWAETFDRELTAANIFTIQSEIATAIADALRATLTEEEQQRIAAVPTENLDAYNYYLSSIEYTRRRGDEHLAAQQLERAVEEDPEFAQAWAGLSHVYSQLYWFSNQTLEEHRVKAREAVDRALAIDPNLPEAHFALGHYYYHGLRDYEEALKELAIAEQGMPGNTEVLAYQAYIQRRMGHWQQASDLALRIFELNPRDASNLVDLATIFTILGEYDQTGKFLDAALKVMPDLQAAYLGKAEIPLVSKGDWATYKQILEDAPVDFDDHEDLFWTAAIYARDFELALNLVQDWEPKDDFPGFPGIRKTIVVAATYYMSGDPEKAAQQYVDIVPRLTELQEEAPESPFSTLIVGHVQAINGEYEKAIETARRATALLPVTEDALAGKDIQLNAIKFVYLLAGAYDLAIEELDDYLSSPTQWRIEGLLPDPIFDPLRNHPDFLALVEKYKRD